MSQAHASSSGSGPTANRSNKIRTTIPEKLFDLLNYTFFILIAAVTIFPFLNLIAKSLSSEEAVISGIVNIIPVDIQFGTYKFVLSEELFLSSFQNSVLITAAGTLLGVFMTSLAAYPLSKLYLRGRKLFIMFFVFTMLFSGGLIPSYLLMQQLHMVNTLWVLFVPQMVNVYFLLIIKSYFEGMPDSLDESAKMDGANNFTIFIMIMLPLSMPVLATISLFFAVSFWNDFFASMVYITNPELKPLQLYLKEMLAQADDVFLQMDRKLNFDSAMNTTPQAIQAAAIIVVTVPILLVYPFLQKYFVKGVLLGSVKG